jgi:metal-responsive CopG/Arc/MetJ family transcriptional regulator
MQRSTKRSVIPVRFSEEELAKMNSAMERTHLRSRSELIREAVRYFLNDVADMKVIELRAVSKERAKKEILEYIRRNREAETFDIANDLRLDLDLAVRALKELCEEGRIE